jgi:hypothetical protein
MASEWFTKNWLVGQLRDGRVIAKGKNAKVLAAAGNVGMDVRIPDVRAIAHVIEVEFYTQDQTYALWYDKWLYNVSARTGSDYDDIGKESNVVGLTIYQVQAATTLTAEVVVIGRP